MTLGWGHVWLQGPNLNKFGKCRLDDATYQISRLLALLFHTRRLFHVSLYIRLCKTCDSQGGAIFRAQEHNLDKLGEGPLDYAT